MLMPKRVKRRRVFRGRMKGNAMRGNFIAYGEFGLVATEPSWVTSQQIEAARIALTRYTKRGGQVWIKIFPDKPVTKKPAETRMGSGKAKELKAMNKTELEAKVGELKAELFNLRFQLATGQLQNTTVIASTKRDIARCLTVLREQEQKDAQ